MATGVYQIRNLVNGKTYIGSTSRNFNIRNTEHFSLLRNGKHANNHLVAMVEECHTKDIDGNLKIFNKLVLVIKIFIIFAS